jgi:TfoX/Sxy family transcriptional regulator of competence genes
MPYSEKLAKRTREIVALTQNNVKEKKMFGGLCFMVNDKMLVGVEKDRLMVRIDPEKFDELIEKEGCSPMDFTGKIMKGFVFVNYDSLNTQKGLKYWIDVALEYNKIVKVAKKKRNKD